MEIQFFGAAGEVTGSCYLVRGPGVRFLVDCGMFQGGSEARAKNLHALPFDVRDIDFVLLTHAHIDHSGLLPRLTALGYKGPVYTTAATIDLLKVMLLDSAHIQEKDAEWELRHRHRRRVSLRGAPQPLYTVTQATAALKQLQPVAYDEAFSPHPAVRVRFVDAGHILGSASLALEIDGRRLVFSGDLGQPGRPLINDPTPLTEADYVIVESTYGNRLHRPLQETEDELVAAFRRVLQEKRGNIIIPAFAVGRTQELIYVVAGLIRAGRLAPMRICIDSPMATAATRITLNHEALLDDETRELIEWQRRHPQLLDVHFVADVEESIALNEVREGAVILSASGMCDAGRIKYHLRNNLSRPECAVLITGFQAAGTLGRRLVDGARSVRIFGEQVAVRAAIHTIGGLSAHADQSALLGWLGNVRQPPQRVFVVHGEAEAAATLAGAITERLGWRNVVVPGYRQEMLL